MNLFLTKQMTLSWPECLQSSFLTVFTICWDDLVHHENDDSVCEGKHSAGLSLVHMCDNTVALLSICCCSCLLTTARCCSGVSSQVTNNIWCHNTTEHSQQLPGLSDSINTNHIMTISFSNHINSQTIF